MQGAIEAKVDVRCQPGDGTGGGGEQAGDSTDRPTAYQTRRYTSQGTSTAAHKDQYEMRDLEGEGAAPPWLARNDTGGHGAGATSGPDDDHWEEVWAARLHAEAGREEKPVVNTEV